MRHVHPGPWATWAFPSSKPQACAAAHQAVGLGWGGGVLCASSVRGGEAPCSLEARGPANSPSYPPLHTHTLTRTHTHTHPCGIIKLGLTLLWSLSIFKSNVGLTFEIQQPSPSVTRQRDDHTFNSAGHIVSHPTLCTWTGVWRREPALRSAGLNLNRSLTAQASCHTEYASSVWRLACFMPCGPEGKPHTATCAGPRKQ